MKKLIAIVLASCVVMGLMACDREPQETQATTLAAAEATTQATEPAEDPILAQRRDVAESYMRSMATYMWRATEDIVYTRDANVVTDEDLAAYTGKELIAIRAGRLYRGVPYSYAGAPAVNFYDFASEADENGIRTVSGLGWKSLNGNSKTGRVGNDCSGAIALSWNYIGADIKPSNTERMVQNRGYLPVGDYVNNPEKNIMTKDVCLMNGGDVMFAAYAQLKKADAIVYRAESFGHTQMIVSVDVVYKEDGKIDPLKSTVTTIDQTSAYIKDELWYFDPQYGENVYCTFGVDKTYTFLDLMDDGYLPVTCRAFIDPAPVAEAYATDSVTDHSLENIFSGVFTSNRVLSSVTVTVTDAQGEQVGSVTCYNPRQSGVNVFTFDLSQIPEEPEHLLRGSLDIGSLEPGTYRCAHVLRDAHGTEYTMRDFEFAV